MTAVLPSSDLAATRRYRRALVGPVLVLPLVGGIADRSQRTARERPGLPPELEAELLAGR